MGTNFYFTTTHADLIHIGKASAGWVFSLHVSTPGKDEICACGVPIRDWESMKAALQGATRIYDEYEDEYTAKEMIKLVEEPWSRNREEALRYEGSMGRHSRLDTYGRWRWSGPRYPEDSRYVGSPPDEFPYDYFCGDFS